MMPAAPLTDAELQACVEALREGDARRLARALTWIENQDPAADQLLSALWSRGAESAREGESQPAADAVATIRVGFTGAPGVGKSSVIAELLGRLRQLGERVAVLAVDPTSPLSGGALLGDRVRMDAHATGDDDVFIRSLATRGGRGGVARCTDDAALLLEWAGFSVILIETVGVGQLELEIVEEADHVVLLVSPESGDTMQFLKGGMMEVVDELVINKGDRPGADAMQSLAEELARDREISAPHRISAHAGDGFVEWVDALACRLSELRAARQLPAEVAKVGDVVGKESPVELRRQRRLTRSLSRRAEEMWLAECWSRLGGREQIERMSREVCSGSRTFLDVVGALKVDALKKGTPPR